ncbi:MAG: TIR domain-containing protein [Flavobacteriales bacterium]|nr:TIR domain-containing protein [Flavobacteriales bacterium]
MPSNTHNVFISHYGHDDKHVQRLKQRLIANGQNVRNSSIDSTKHKNGKIPSDRVIARYLRRGISWAKTFICLIGPETHNRPWVNYEIREAYRQGKTIVGIYTHGSNNSVELPEAYKKYGGSPIGWNSLDKLADIMQGKVVAPENPDGTPSGPIHNIVRIKC